MNYIQEVNAFYNWLEFNSISGNTQALWHLLMHFNNKCGWAKEFSIANSRITSSLGISRTELDRIRNVLVQKELLKYKKGTGNKAGIYSLIKFVAHNVTQVTTQATTQDSTQVLTQPITQDRHYSCTLNKQNKTKQNEDKEKIKEKKRGGEKSSKPKKSEKQVLAETLESFIMELDYSEKLKNALREFVAYRKDNTPLTELALTKLVNKLNGFGYTDSQNIECLDNSILNGWRGVFKLDKHAQIIKQNQEKEGAKQFQKFGGTYL